MNLLDLMLAIPIAFLMFKGWKRGLVREVATLAGVLAGIWASVHLSQKVADLLNLDSEHSVLIAFFVCFVGALVLAYLLGRAVEGMMKAAHIGLANRILGALLGMAKALCVLAVLLNYVVMLDRHEAVLSPSAKEKSLIFKPVFSTGNQLTASLKSYIADHKDSWRKELTQ